MSTESEVKTAVERLITGSPECCDRAGLDELVRESSRVRSWLDAYDTRIALRARALEQEGRSESPAEVLSNRGRRSASESRAAGKRAGTCAEHPNFHDALASGEISAGHVDALGRASTGLQPAEKAAFSDRSTELLEHARGMSVDEFAKTCQATARECRADDGVSEQERLRRQRTISRRRDEDTGMVITRVVLDPVADERLWNSIDRATKKKLLSGTLPADTRWDQVAVDWVVDRLTGPSTTTATREAAPTPSEAPAASDGSPPAPADTLFPMAPADGDAATSDDVEPVTAESPDVIVMIDWDALAGAATDAGLVAETLGGVPMPVSTVRRLCCDARIIPTVLNGDGVPLDMGRGARLATPEQRRALAVMYAACAYPGCQVRFAHCKIHHTKEWLRDHGPTDLACLVPLCDRHHHLVHEGGWRLEVDPDRTITVTRPDGEVHYRGPGLNRRRRPPPPAA